MSMNFVNEPTRAWDPKNRLREMINEGSDAANVDKLVELLIMDGFDFSLTADAMTPIDEAERVVSVGMGIAVKSEMYPFLWKLYWRDKKLHRSFEFFLEVLG